MRLSKKEILDASPPIPKKITVKTREQTKANASRFRGSMRIACGKFYTDKEFESRRKRVLNTPLP